MWGPVPAHFLDGCQVFGCSTMILEVRIGSENLDNSENEDTVVLTHLDE